MIEILMKRISIGSSFKICFFGLLAGMAPLIVILTLSALMGMGGITWNGSEVTGLPALLFGPLVGIMLSVLFTIFMAPIIWLGLLILSKTNFKIKVNYIGS